MFLRHIGLLFLICFAGCIRKGASETGENVNREAQGTSDSIIQGFDIQACSREVLRQIDMYSVTSVGDEMDLDRLKFAREQKMSDFESGDGRKKYLSALVKLSEKHGSKVIHRTQLDLILKDLVLEIKHLFLASKKNGLNPHMLRAALLGVQYCAKSSSYEGSIWGLSVAGFNLRQLLSLFWESVNTFGDQDYISRQRSQKINFLKVLAECQAERTRDPFSNAHIFEDTTEDTAISPSKFVFRLLEAVPEVAGREHSGFSERRLL